MLKQIPSFRKKRKVEFIINMWTKEKEMIQINKIQDSYVLELKNKIISSNGSEVYCHEINFTSPTGTGKTNMMAKLINSLPDAFFIITTLSKGQLHKQVVSGISENAFGNNYVIYGVQDYTRASTLKEQDIIDNIPKDKKIYWLRDEAHIKTNKWSPLLENICEKIINFSATNENVGIVCDFTQTMMLRTVKQQTGTIVDALEKLVEVKGWHKQVLKYNPCAIFRIVSSDAEREIIKESKNLGLKYITLVDNDNYNMADICKDDNAYDVIINKQKIVEGIDIRRAHILWIEHRQPKATTTIQVIGRCRRNALLYRDDIDILNPKNKDLLEHTRQCFVFYKEKMQLDTNKNGEFIIAFCPYVSIQKLKAGYTVHVDNGMLPNGLIVKELEEKSGDYLILKDKNTGFNIIKDKDFYKFNLYKRKIPTANFCKKNSINFLNLYDYVPSIKNDKELSILSSDVFQLSTGVFKEKIWTENKTVTAHIGCDCKFSRFLKKEFINELSLAEKKYFKKYNDYGFSKKLNSCVGVVSELFGKYLAYGELWIDKKFLRESIREFEEKGIKIVFKYYSEYHISNMWNPNAVSLDDIIESDDALLKNKIVIRACILSYRAFINETYGKGASSRLRLPSVDELINNNDFLITVQTLGETIADFIRDNINIKEALEIKHCFITDKFIGVADVMDKNTIIEIKCTNQVNEKMLLQALGYYYLSKYRADVNITKVIVFDAVSKRSIKIPLPELRKRKELIQNYKKIRDRVEKVNMALYPRKQ